MKSYILALIAACGFCVISLPGCGRSDNSVVQPPETEPSDVPVEGMSDEDYAREMAEATGQ